LLSRDPEEMLASLLAGLESTSGRPFLSRRRRPEGELQRVASERKLKLYACACCRHIWHLIVDQRSREAVEIAERCAEGMANEGEKEAALQAAEQARAEARESAAGVHSPWSSLVEEVAIRASDAAWSVLLSMSACARSARLATAQPGEEIRQCHLLRDIFGNPFRPVQMDPSWLSWEGGTLPKLARAIYEERDLPGGTLDTARLGILADALEDAGCTQPVLLDHLRTWGRHVRGCWAVDALLSLR